MWSRPTCHTRATMGFGPFLIYLLRRLFLPNSLRTMEWTMLRLLNRDRRRHGLKPLFMQEDLRQTARKHSRDMAKKDYFDHTNLHGQSHADRYKEDGISDVISGENLAKIGGYSHPVHRAEIGLMNSPGHRANILNEQYNCVGVGVHKSETKVYYYTQNFAKRALIFTRKVKSSVKRRHGLSLTFKPVGPVKIGVYRVFEDNRVIKEKGFLIKNGLNRLQIPFNQRGRYRLEIYTGIKATQPLKMANSFDLKVTEGWFS